MSGRQWGLVLVVLAMSGVAIGLWLQPPDPLQAAADPHEGQRSAIAASAPAAASYFVADAGKPQVSGDPSGAPEAELMARARELLSADPERALALLEQADERYGSDHEQRRALEIETLVKLSRIGAAHAKADDFYRRFPESGAQGQIERLTGYHPRPYRRN